MVDARELYDRNLRAIAYICKCETRKNNRREMVKSIGGAVLFAIVGIIILIKIFGGF
jgi:hypothetical protein